MYSPLDHQAMAEAISLARRGMYTCAPNPRVGCVLVRDGRTLGRGWHRCAGAEHAEIAALRDANEEARGATAYVTLEPCAHHGRTPPCADALIAAGISRVVVAVGDPNPRVAGKGLQQLAEAGIAIESGLQANAARALNPGHFKRHAIGRPWLRCKMAASLDGRTAMASGESQWITRAPARMDVQLWRARSCAVMTGIGTAMADDPRLSVRESDLPAEARLGAERQQPVRVILDSQLRLSTSSKLLSGAEVLVLTASEDRERTAALADCGATVKVVKSVNAGLDLDDVLVELARREINEVQVEAGPTLAGNLLRQGLVDELLLYLAPRLLGSSARPMFELPFDTMAQSLDMRLVDQRMVGADLRLTLSALDSDSGTSSAAEQDN